jgi:hypothetical protein
MISKFHTFVRVWVDNNGLKISDFIGKIAQMLPVLAGGRECSSTSGFLVNCIAFLSFHTLSGFWLNNVIVLDQGRITIRLSSSILK